MLRYFYNFFWTFINFMVITKLGAIDWHSKQLDSQDEVAEVFLDTFDKHDYSLRIGTTNTNWQVGLHYASVKIKKVNISRNNIRKKCFSYVLCQSQLFAVKIEYYLTGLNDWESVFWQIVYWIISNISWFCAFCG